MRRRGGVQVFPELCDIAITVSLTVFLTNIVKGDSAVDTFEVAFTKRSENFVLLSSKLAEDLFDRKFVHGHGCDGDETCVLCAKERIRQRGNDRVQMRDYFICVTKVIDVRHVSPQEHFPGKLNSRLENIRIGGRQKREVAEFLALTQCGVPFGQFGGFDFAQTL